MGFSSAISTVKYKSTNNSSTWRLYNDYAGTTLLASGTGTAGTITTINASAYTAKMFLVFCSDEHLKDVEVVLK